TLPTLLGLSDDPALIPGWGPVLAEIARHVALDQAHPPSWQYAITDRRGHLRHAGPIRRRPSAAAVRVTRLRDRSCRAVNCRRHPPPPPTAPHRRPPTSHRRGRRHRPAHPPPPLPPPPPPQPRKPPPPAPARHRPLPGARPQRPPMERPRRPHRPAHHRRRLS